MSRNVANEYKIVWCNHEYLFLHCIRSVLYYKTLVSNTCMVYSEQTMVIFLSEICFRFLTWLGMMLGGKPHEYVGDVQRLVTVVSYLYLSPGKGSYNTKCVYFRFMIEIQNILPHITKRRQRQKNKKERNKKKWEVICCAEYFRMRNACLDSSL